MKQEVIDDLEAYYVISYSVKQDCTMVETIIDSVKKNRRALMSGRFSDFLPVLVTDAREKADFIANQIRLEIEKEGISRNNWESIANVLDRLDPLTAQSMRATG